MRSTNAARKGQTWEPQKRKRANQLSELASRIAIPLLGACAMIALWAAYVWLSEVPPYILSGPDKVVTTLISDWPKLGPALGITTKTTLLALLCALIGGGGIALLLAQAR
jgi:NitT/TauT family transport system permease protein